MKLKTSYYYQFSECRNDVAVFYIVMILVMVAAVSFSSVATIGEFKEESFGIYSSFDGSSLFFLFIVGMCSFTDEFLFLMQNGISRKTILLSRIFTAMSLCAIMSLVDKILTRLIGAISAWANKGLELVSITEQVFGDMNIFFDLILTFSLYLSLISIGYVMAIIYYRLTATGWWNLCWIGSIGVFLALAVFDALVFDYVMVSSLVIFLDFAYGLSTGAPINAMITSFCVFLLCSLASFLLIRRIPVKE